MNKLPSIIYWKWDDQTLNPESIQAKVIDLTSRTNIEAIFVSVHWIHRPIDDPFLLECLQVCCQMLLERGRKLYLEVCPRNEGSAFHQFHPNDVAYLVSFEEITLDQNGQGETHLPVEPVYHYWRVAGENGPATVVQAWCFHSTEKGRFDPDSLSSIRDRVSIKMIRQEYESGGHYIVAGNTSQVGGENKRVMVRVEAGVENANKIALLCLGTPQPIPDLASPHLYELYDKMLAAVASIPLAGICSDEWGYDVILKISEPNPYDDHQLSMRHLSFSNTLSQRYNKIYGRKLEDELLLMRYAPEKAEHLQIAAINRYVTCLRLLMSENDQGMYERAKQTFGSDLFYGVHPTWWGSVDSLNFEVFKNGFYWWEAKRDYAQTDEAVTLPIRTALAHKWGSPVWFNMWYSYGTRDIRTYFQETWRNVRYGGRTHYHGYECPNEPVVLELYQAGLLEQIEAMEKEIRLLNEVPPSQPDCQVLILFGMEAVTNWALSGNPQGPWKPQNPLLDGVLNFADQLFDDYLCDLVPTSEICNNSLTLDDEGFPVYGNQKYQAVILLHPDCMDRLAHQFIQKIQKGPAHLMVAGPYNLYCDGEPLGDLDRHALDQACKTREGVPIFAEVVEWLQGRDIPRHRFPQGCVFQNGSWLFTAQGGRSTGNPLFISETCSGVKIQFEGTDFLYLNLDSLHPKALFPPGGILKIEGQLYENSLPQERGISI